ncbi:MAG: alpha/beta hydrolase [Gammaproteobacteria bacterium]|nr:alpha/beta hydrolase [Gammaproteobacteria bacterium]
MNASKTKTAPQNSTSVRAPVFSRLVPALGRGLSRLSPGLTARLAAWLGLKPPRHAHPASERPWLASARRSWLSTQGLPIPAWDGKPLALYRWGEPRLGRVLLMHGWGGRATQLAAFIPEFVAAGYEVVAVDAPGHGLSAGKQASLFHFANALERALAETGPVEAVIAHSFGGAATALAATRGARFGKAVLIAPPSDLNDYLDTMCRLLGLSGRVRRDLQARYEAILATPFAELRVSPENLRGLRQPALVIHDEEDGEVPAETGRRVAAAWPGARFITTRGLGHRRILKDAGVVRLAVDFVGSGRAAVELAARGTGALQEQPGIIAA